MMATYRAVGTTGSLSAAARALYVSQQPTVRNQIATPEPHLGVALFTRSLTGLSPAPATAGLAALVAE